MKALRVWVPLGQRRLAKLEERARRVGLSPQELARRMLVEALDRQLFADLGTIPPEPRQAAE